MATIYRARDNQLQRDVAVKILRPEYGARPRLHRSLPARGAVRGLAEPSERRRRVRLRHGPSRAVHRHGARRGRGPPSILRRSGALPPRRRPADGPGRPRRCGRPRARLRPPGRQARQHARGPRGPGEGRRLRDRPRALRVRADPARHDAGLGPLLQPGAGARRARDPGLRHLQPGHRPVRAAHGPAAVDGRQRGGDRDRAAHRRGAEPIRGAQRRPAQPRGDHAEGPGAERRRPLRVRGRHGRRPGGVSRGGAGLRQHSRACRGRGRRRRGRSRRRGRPAGSRRGGRRCRPRGRGCGRRRAGRRCRRAQALPEPLDRRRLPPASHDPTRERESTIPARPTRTARAGPAPAASRPRRNLPRTTRGRRGRARGCGSRRCWPSASSRSRPSSWSGSSAAPANPRDRRWRSPDSSA